jgi:hypothetical protein
VPHPPALRATPARVPATTVAKPLQPVDGSVTERATEWRRLPLLPLPRPLNAAIAGPS